jgi:TolB-like protein/tetratricopeptide (TPR) repeat protein
MKRCPKCGRNYSDETLNFCLDDGAALLDGPGTGEAATELLTSESPTRAYAEHQTEEDSSRFTSRGRPGQQESLRNSLVTAIVAVILLAAIGLGAYWYYQRPATRQINSIAVMPFSNESGTPDAEYLSDGITDSLINSLSKIQGLNVKARSSVFRYKGQNVEPTRLGTELSVNAVLNGRVVQRGDDLSVYLSLVDTQTGDQIWGEGYERKLADLVAVQKDITRDVSEKLQLRLSGADVQRVTRTYTNDPEAYQLYLRGRYRILKSNQTDVEASIKYFQQAIDRDPTFALAYVGLADGYRAPVSERLPSEALAKSKAAAQKALEIDDTLADAHAVLGFIIFWYEWNWAASEAELKRAIELDPKNADAHNFYAHLLSNIGRHDEALAEAKRSRELDPLNLRACALEGQFLVHAGQVDAGISRLNALLELDPNHWMVHLFLTSGYIEKGMWDKAIEEGRKTVEINPHTRSFSYLGYALAKAGREREAHEELDRILALGKERWISPYSTALLYNGLNDHDKTFAWLEKGLSDRDPRMVFLKVEPKWNNLRDDPRFQKVMMAVGF